MTAEHGDPDRPPTDQPDEPSPDVTALIELVAAWINDGATEPEIRLLDQLGRPAEAAELRAQAQAIQ